MAVCSRLQEVGSSATPLTCHVLKGWLAKFLGILKFNDLRRTLGG